MHFRNHKSKLDARLEAGRNDYVPISRCDGLEVWSKPGRDDIVLIREDRQRSSVWHWHKPVPVDVDWRTKISEGF